MIQRKSDQIYVAPEVNVINVEATQVCVVSNTTEKFTPVDPDDDFNNSWTY